MSKTDFDAKVINMNNEMDTAKQKTRQELETLKWTFHEEIAQAK